MADLTFLEKYHLEELFQMRSGYVLDFNNRTFQGFVADAVGKDIEDSKYQAVSGSKAHRLRKFWEIEPNHIVGKLIEKLIHRAKSIFAGDKSLIEKAEKVAERLVSDSNVAEISVITAPEEDRTFDALARGVRESIENHQPEVGLDRLHTYVVKYVGTLCTSRGISTERGKPLHSMFGEYVKHLRAKGEIESEMTERILKSCISTLEAFNHVRNEQSLAHDNPMLNYDESLFIYTHVCALVRLLQTIEQLHSTASSHDSNTDEFPF